MDSTNIDEIPHYEYVIEIKERGGCKSLYVNGCKTPKITFVRKEHYVIINETTKPIVFRFKRNKSKYEVIVEDKQYLIFNKNYKGRYFVYGYPEIGGKIKKHNEYGAQTDVLSAEWISFSGAGLIRKEANNLVSINWTSLEKALSGLLFNYMDHQRQYRIGFHNFILWFYDFKKACNGKEVSFLMLNRLLINGYKHIKYALMAIETTCNEFSERYDIYDPNLVQNFITNAKNFLVVRKQITIPLDSFYSLIAAVIVYGKISNENSLKIFKHMTQVFVKLTNLTRDVNMRKRLSNL
jgi:hypothetical protein